MEDTQLILNAIYDLKCFCLAIYFMIILTCPSKFGFPLNAILLAHNVIALKKSVR